MAKLNVYVPDDLKRKMDAVKEPVNWSSLACSAFKGALRRTNGSARRPARHVHPQVLADVAAIFARCFETYRHSSDQTQEVIRDMAAIIADPASDTDEREMAANTLTEALFGV
jgi:hypothetical protein